MSRGRSPGCPIRTAVIGFGLAGRVFHCPFISAVPALELAAVMQRRGNEAQTAYPQIHVGRALEQILDDESIELVVVATPNETHFTIARQVLLAGKHCVVDKPFAATSAEATELVDLATQKERLIVPFHNRRFDGDLLTVKKLIADETLGRIVEINSRFDRFRPTLREGSWKEEQSKASGILFDLGTHLVDQALGLFGLPDSIDCRVYRDRDGSVVADAFDLVLAYRKRGMRYRCGCSMLAADAAPRFRVMGTRGSYTKHGVDPQEAVVGQGARPPLIESGEPWLPETESAWGALTLAEALEVPAKLSRSVQPTVPGDYRRFYENVSEAIRGTAELAISPEDGYRSIRLIELALQSNAEGRSIPVAM